METRKLGYSDLHLTTLGLGTWSMGGDWEWGWGSQDERESVETIRRALDLGINWIDTAPAYGLGRSEQTVGKAIRGRRDEVLIATKCGLVWDDPDAWAVDNRLKKASVKREAEESLRRLGIEVIDLYQIHWPVPEEDIEEGWEAVAELIQEGKVRYGGVSNFNVAQMKRAQAIHPIASLQPPYSMLDREVEKEILPFCQEHNIGVVAYSPLRSGLLTAKFGRERLERMEETDWRLNDEDFQEPRVTANLEFMKQLKALANEVQRPVEQLAIAWVVAQPAVTSAIVGARRPEQIEASAPAGEYQIREHTMQAIAALLEQREERLAVLS